MVTYQSFVHKRIHLVQVCGIDNGAKIVQYKLNSLHIVLKRGCVWLTCFYDWCVCAFVYVWTSCTPPLISVLPPLHPNFTFIVCVCVCVCVCVQCVCVYVGCVCVCVCAGTY